MSARRDVKGRRLFSCHWGWVAIEEFRARQPPVVRVIRKQQLPLLEAVDHCMRHLRTQCRAAVAASEPALLERKQRIDVPGAMHDDGPRTRMVIDARFQS